MPPQDDRVAAPESRWATLAETGFRNLEHGAYLVLGLLLAGASVLALVDAAVGLGHAALDWSGTDSIVAAVDQLLFVFMLIEILHTVRASLRTGGLSCEPFLVVGLIATIRRVLIITLKSSETTKQETMTDMAQRVFQASMLELVVLAVLIIVMVASIRILRRPRRGTRSTPRNPETSPK